MLRLAVRSSKLYNPHCAVGQSNSSTSTSSTSSTSTSSSSSHTTTKFLTTESYSTPLSRSLLTLHPSTQLQKAFALPLQLHRRRPPSAKTRLIMPGKHVHFGDNIILPESPLPSSRGPRTPPQQYIPLPPPLPIGPIAIHPLLAFHPYIPAIVYDVSRPPHTVTANAPSSPPGSNLTEITPTAREDHKSRRSRRRKRRR